jgi:MFS family permease
MDFVAKKRRGIWNSIEGLSFGLFWNLSALLGGIIIDSSSYRVCFLATAGIYFVGCIPLLFLIPLVKNETKVSQEVKELKHVDQEMAEPTNDEEASFLKSEAQPSQE